MNAHTTKSSLWKRYALLASLMLNLFLVAIIAGHLLRHGVSEAAIGSPSLPRILANAQANLSPSDATAFGAVMRRDAPRYIASAKRLADARAELERQITGQPYDEVAVRQAFAEWQAAANSFLSDVSHPLVEALGKISVEGREELVENRHKTTAALRIR